MPEAPSQLKQFAELIGSKKGTWPVPPDQITAYQDKRHPLTVRLWSVLVECSTAPDQRQGPATKGGKPLTIKDAAKILDAPVSSTQQAWEELEDEHWVRRAKDLLWIRGEFKLGRRKSKSKNVVQRLPPGLRKEISKLPDHDRAAFLAECEADFKAEDLITADLTAAKRFIFGQRQNSRCARYGVKIKRERQRAKHGKEVEKAERDRRVLLILPEIQKVVQPFLELISVQPSQGVVQPSPETPEIAASTTPTKASQLDPGLLSQSRENQDSKPTPTATEKQQPQQFHLSRFPLTDSAITKRFPACNQEYRERIVRAALAVDPLRVNDKTIAQAVEEATTKDQRSAALYIQTVPTVLAAWLREHDRRKSA